MIRLIAIAMLFAVLTCARARAASEFCAGSVLRVLPIHGVASKGNLGTDTAFGLQVRAEAPRTISGLLYIYAGGDLYQIPFSDIELKLRKKQLVDRRTGGKLLDYVEAQSDPLYFRFDSPKRVDAVWVASAGSGAAQVDCPTMPLVDSSSDTHAWGPEDGAKVPEDYMRAQAPASPPRAVFNAHVNAGSCTALFKDTKANNPLVPRFPFGSRFISDDRTVFVKVLLSSSGNVADAWIFGSSGDKRLDDAALQSARTTTYVPAQFLCVPIPGVYLFRVDFHPQGRPTII